MMEFDPQDQDIVGLLTKLKSENGGYPAEMLAARRKSYLKQMAQVGLGGGLATGLKEAAKQSTNTPTVSSATSTLLEAALAVAILAEASTVAYFYRDKIAAFFQGDVTNPKVQEVVSAVPTLFEIQESPVPPSPAVTTAVSSAVPSSATVPSASSTAVAVTASSTAIPGVVEDNQPGSASSVGNATSSGAALNQTDSTPAPNDNTNGNSGNHYGQTPKPERTKESGNNDSGNMNPGHNDTGVNNNDSAPQTNNEQTPKDNSKPTKTK